MSIGEVDFMSVSVSDSVSSIKDVTIATTGKGEPNWSYIPSAGKSNKTKAEFTSEIKELAKKAALPTNKTESEYISRQVLQLKVCIGRWRHVDLSNFNNGRLWCCY